MVLNKQRVAGISLLIAASLLLAIGCSDPNDAPGNTPSTAPPSDGQIQRAYTMKCSLCHGTDGRLMASKAPDLSLSKLSVEERVALITYGKGTMPPQKGILDDATIRGIAKYIEQFRD